MEKLSTSRESKLVRQFVDPLSWRFLRSESRPSDSIQLFVRKFIAVVSSYSEWLAEASAQFAAPSIPEGAAGYS